MTSICKRKGRASIWRLRPSRRSPSGSLIGNSWALWSARNKTSGLIPNSSDNVSIGALNTTTGVAWNLPSAVRRGWVTQSDADAWMGQLVTSLNTNRNQTTYLPTRFLDLVTAAPVTDHEESSIDASFICLALHNYAVAGHDLADLEMRRSTRWRIASISRHFPVREPISKPIFSRPASLAAVPTAATPMRTR